MNLLMFIAVCLITTGVAGIAIMLTRGITFYGSATDNHKQVFTASTAGSWKWPSDMHKVIEEGFRTRMKDGFILGLVCVQRIMRNKTGDHPTVVLILTTNAISGILIYLVAAEYWSTTAGLVVWALYLTCLWPYQLALFGTHVGVSNMFCLLCILLMQQTGAESYYQSILYYVLSGIALGLTLFSSGSSRKFLPLIVSAFIYSQRSELWLPSWDINLRGPIGSEFNIAVTLVAGLSVVACLVVLLGYRKLVGAMYYESVPYWLSRIIKIREPLDADHYKAQASLYVPAITSSVLILACYLFLSTLVVKSAYFYLSHIGVLIGLAFILLILTYPSVFANLWAYYRHSQGWKTNRFQVMPEYEEHFTKLGRPYKGWMRGGGPVWVLKLFNRLTPVQLSFFVASVVGLIVVNILVNNHLWFTLTVIVITLVSLSPILVGELTKSTQSGRYYYAGLLGLFLPVGYAVHEFEKILMGQWLAICLGLMASIILVGGLWSIRMFITDVLPSRMAPAKLAKVLGSLGVEQFYTYDTLYNDAFLGAIPVDVLGQYAIRYIESLDDVESGYVIIPGTSSKALNMESVGWALEHGDFNLDPKLTELIESKQIESCSVECFKTFGSSRFWQQEAEMTSYRDLIVNEIHEADRWRGLGWVIDVAKIKGLKGNK